MENKNELQLKLSGEMGYQSDQELYLRGLNTIVRRDL